MRCRSLGSFPAPPPSSAWTLTRRSGCVEACAEFAGWPSCAGMSSASSFSTPKRRLPLSATELSGFFECEHSTWLNLSVLRGERERPGQNELERWMLEYRGRAHEARLLAWYREQGLQ